MVEIALFTTKKLFFGLLKQLLAFSKLKSRFLDNTPPGVFKNAQFDYGKVPLVLFVIEAIEKFALR